MAGSYGQRCRLTVNRWRSRGPARDRTPGPDAIPSTSTSSWSARRPSGSSPRIPDATGREVGHPTAARSHTSETSSRGAIYLLSPVTGTQRKLIDFPVTFGLAWSPDGRWLIVAGDATPPDRGGIYAIPVDGGAPRRVVQSESAQVLVSPSLAPDGHHLAYLACEFVGSAPTCGIDVVELDERWQPVAASRRLTNKAYNLGGVAWSRDGASVIYTIQPLPETFYLSRAWITGNRAPERLDLAGQGARMPAMASAGNRLAFVRTQNTVGVYTLGPAPRPVLVSSFWDIQPQFSPDGNQLVFASSRSGEAPRRLARCGGRVQCAPVDAWARQLAGLTLVVTGRSPDCV